MRRGTIHAMPTSAPPATPDLTVQHSPERRCFEATVGGRRSSLDYRLDGHVMSILHTGVPPELEGRGIAAALTAAALGHARAAGWTVRPLCSYARTYVQRHPETADLLAR